MSATEEITLISGPPGAGKTTVARTLASQARTATAVHLHTDDFFNAIAKGFIEPWEPESTHQNKTLTKAIAAAATQLVNGGFEVIVDGVIGPWFLPDYLLAFDGLTINYVVLRPTQDEVAKRARERKEGPLANYPPRIYAGFAQLGELEAHVIDSSVQTVRETIDVVRSGLLAGRFRLDTSRAY